MLKIEVIGNLGAQAETKSQNGDSIHAPTWGATESFYTVRNKTEFQSTRPRGARQAAPPPISAAPSFNPRAHVGRDAICLVKARICNSFNPRAHVGRDIHKLYLLV